MNQGFAVLNQGFTVWFTGLSGAGKTTLAHLLEARLRERGITKIEILDGDVVRTHLNKGLGFSREDRDTNVRRIGFVCHLLTRNDLVAIAAAISPYREARDWARQQIGNFVEVFVRCPLEVLIERDPKGLYKKALAGEISNFTGVSDPYEDPLAPEVVVDSDRQNPAACVERILLKLEELGYLAPSPHLNGQPSDADVYSEEEEAVVNQRLKNLGYI